MAQLMFFLLIALNSMKQTSSHLSGLFESAPTQHTDMELNKTEGSPPAWLNGALYRVGPGMYEYGGRSVNNVVDGLAKVHGWVFKGEGNVRYTATMLPSNVYNATLNSGIFAPFPVMGDVMPDFSVTEKLYMLTKGFDNTNIAVWDLDGGKSVTLCTESHIMNQVLPYSLKYKRSMTSSAVNQIGAHRKALFSASHFAKHPSGTSFNYILSMSLLPGRMSELSYDFFEYSHSTTGDVQTRRIGSIPCSVKDMRMIHQFGITENFLVIPRFNYKFMPRLSMSDMCKLMSFNYEKPCYMDVISIATGEVHSFELPGQKGVHIINSIERRNSHGHLEVVIDVPTTTDIYKEDLNKQCLFDALKIPYLLDADFMYKNIPWDNTIRRFVFNLNNNTYSIERFPKSWKPVDALVDFPFINPSYIGKEYCYAYFQQWQLSSMAMDLMKYDLCTKTAITWHEPNKHAMEPVFVANPKGTAEDDGVIVAPVYDSNTSSTELLVWDAADLNVLARYDNLVAVPYTIHGWWFD